ELPVRAAPPLSIAGQRDLRGWLASLGLDTQQRDPIRSIATAELARAQAIDPRVSADDMQRAVQLSVAAAQMTPAQQRVLYGFTGLVDAKLPLTAGPGRKSAIDVLAAAAAATPDDAKDLLRAIDVGPGNGEQNILKPQTKTELVAALVRFVVLG